MSNQRNMWWINAKTVGKKIRNLSEFALRIFTQGWQGRLRCKLWGYKWKSLSSSSLRRVLGWADTEKQWNTRSGIANTGKSITRGAQYVTLQKYFSHPSYFFFFSNPIHKTKTNRTQNKLETNSKPPWPMIMIGQSKTGRSTQIILITFLWEVLVCAVPFTNLSKLCKKPGSKPFYWAKPTGFDFS